ncbi:hypothetical protein BDD43_5689 [Mucilaginibacter gracilis]|uniref:Uncharacterized protein n=1 Tax=Mucilaginibacter gracilis TaxID=423350 RepID=A0A495JAB6_9SPHI|nr:hypothetical protein [Mucilaginibacter gracilis]RKR85418.1 hypothetical protein BDD43_5689 [Mucilaginibacter gracilis]
MSFSRFFYNKNSLKRKILDIKADIENTVFSYCTEKFDITWYGAYDIDPKHLVYWICIKTDKVKHELESNLELNQLLRSLLEKHRYPLAAQPHVFISFESQETVDRESDGNWYHHFK